MIVIIKYNAGNLTSVKNALERLGYTCLITDNPNKIKNASKVIFPGVGNAASAMQFLIKNKLNQLIVSLTQPVLGICLGQQLLCQFSEEGNTPCLGVFDISVKKFPPNDIIPHMGWNNIYNLKSNILFNNVPENANVYFVHSYYCPLSKYTIAESNYILPFSAAIQKNNFFATQFHPEKSSDFGEQILKNFLEL